MIKPKNTILPQTIKEPITPIAGLDDSNQKQVKVFLNGKRIGVFNSLEDAKAKYQWKKIPKDLINKLSLMFPIVVENYVICHTSVKFIAKYSKDPDNLANIDFRKDARGGARLPVYDKNGKLIKKPAGAHKKTPDKKRRGFYCHTTEAKAAKLGKGDWERGLQKIQKQVQKHIDENF